MYVLRRGMLYLAFATKRGMLGRTGGALVLWETESAMAKRKNGPALLELMQREKEDAANRAADETNGRKSWLSRASWGRPVGAAATVEPVLESAPPPEASVVEERSAVEERFEDSPAAPSTVKAIPGPAVRAEPVESFEPPRMFRVEDGRVHLSLNPFSAVVAVGSVLLAIFAGFVMGRVTAVGAEESSGPATAVSPIEEAVKGPAKPMVLDDPAGKRARPVEREAVPAPVAPTVAGIESADPREPGKNYFRLMTADPDHRKDAEAAQAFLADNGVKAWVVQKQNRWLVFDVTRGFTWRELDSPVGRQRKKQLERLGAKFFEENQSYNFTGLYAEKAPDR